MINIKKILLLAFFALTFNAFSQKNIAKSIDVNQNNYSDFISISENYLKTNPDSAKQIAEKIIQFSTEGSVTAKAQVILAKANFYLADYPKSITDLKKSITYYKEIDEKAKVAELLNLIGAVYQTWGAFEKSIEYYFLAVNAFKELNNEDKLASVYNNIGLTYKELNKPKFALDFYKKAYKIAKKANDEYAVSYISNNLGSGYTAFNQYDTAKYYFEESVELKKKLNNEIGLAHCYGNLSDMYIQMEDYKKALEYLKKVKFISERFEDLNIRALVNSSLGKVYTKLEIYNLAEDYLIQAMNYANELKSNNVSLEVAKNFSDLYIETRNYEKATYYLSKYVSIKDSIYSDNNIKKIAEIQSAYDLENSQKENEMLKKINILNEQKLEKAQSLKKYFIIILILSVLLVFVAYKRFKNNGKNTKIIQEKNNEIKEANFKLLKLNAELQNKVENRTDILQKEIKERKNSEQELKKMLENEKKSNTLKDRFLTNISQEIRTPLNAISGLSSLLNFKIKNDSVSEYVVGIQENSNRLLNLLNNIIDFNRIESNKLNLAIESLHLSEVINNVLQLYKFRINDKKIELSIELNDNFKVLADKIYLSKIFNEIIDNAVKYTNNGKIKIIAKELNNNDIVVKIVDSGVGIASDYLPHIFDSFTQESDGLSRKFQGVGLGLPLAKKFIEMNNGKIEISSKKDKGTIVSIVIPKDLDKEHKKIEQNKLMSDEIFKQKEFQIFLVEDDYFNRLMVETILDRIGYVTSAANGNEAIQLVADKNKNGEEFDIMIIDINLPDGWDGISLMKTIREKWPLYNDIIFIAQTAYSDKTDKQRFLSAGFNEYITKPIDSDNLINIIKNRLLK